MFRKFLFSAVLLLAPSVASADTILKLSLGDTGPDFQFISGILSTVDDGNAATPGLQDTAVEFVGPLAGTPNILSGASFSVTGVAAVGGATQTGPVINQLTFGGTFSIWNEVGALLLAGSIADGVISGSSTSDTGTFFNVTNVTYTGGSLLSSIVPNIGGISFALANINSGGLVGLQFVDDDDDDLRDFTADADGLITGEPIPEPMTLLLLGPALLGMAVRRKS